MQHFYSSCLVLIILLAMTEENSLQGIHPVSVDVNTEIFYFIGIKKSFFFKYMFFGV